MPAPELAWAAGSGFAEDSRCRLAGGGGGGGQGRDLPRPHVVSVVLDTNSSATMRAGRTLGRIGLTTLLFPLGRNLKGCKFPTVVVMVFMTHQITCTIVKQQRLHACRVSYMLAKQGIKAHLVTRGVNHCARNWSIPTLLLNQRNALANDLPNQTIVHRLPKLIDPPMQPLGYPRRWPSPRSLMGPSTPCSRSFQCRGRRLEYTEQLPPRQ